MFPKCANTPCVMDEVQVDQSGNFTSSRLGNNGVVTTCSSIRISLKAHLGKTPRLSPVDRVTNCFGIAFA